MSLTIEGLEQFVTSLVASPERWAHLVHHCSDVRVYEQIWEDEDVNAWIICWSVDHDTGFHDHGQSAAGIAVISGHIREERLRIGGRPLGRVIGAGSTLTVPPIAIHRVLHAGESPSVTLHAYSPPLTTTGAYRIGPGGELQRESLSCQEELRAATALG